MNIRHTQQLAHLVMHLATNKQGWFLLFLQGLKPGTTICISLLQNLGATILPPTQTQDSFSPIPASTIPCSITAFRTL